MSFTVTQREKTEMLIRLGNVRKQISFLLQVSQREAQSRSVIFERQKSLQVIELLDD